MALQRAVIFTGGAFNRIVDADSLEVGSGIVPQGANAVIALDGNGSGAIRLGGGAGTGVIEIGLGAGSGAVAISRAGINTAVAGTLGITGAATFTAVANTNGGIQRSSGGALPIGTDANTTSLTAGTNAACTVLTFGNQSATINIGGTAGTAATIEMWGNLTVRGTETIVGGQTFTGLLTVTSSTGSGAAGTLGPEEIRLEMTEAATVGATIRNSGSIRFSGRTWETGTSTSTTQTYGAWGCVIDTITAATGVPTGISYIWRNIDNTATAATLTQAGNLDVRGSLAMRNAGSNAMTIVPSADAAVTITIPAATDTLVNLGGTQTLTAKTLTSPTLGGTVIGTFTIGGTPTLGATLAMNGQTLSGTAAPSGVWTFSSAGTAISVTNNLTAGTLTSGTITNAGNINMDLTGAGTRTLTVQNSTGGQRCDVDIDGNILFRGGNTNAITFVPSTDAAATVTVPAATDTLVNLAGTQTLSAKTLSAPILSGSVTGTYTLNGTPTLGTVTFAGTPTFSGRHVHTATIAIQSGAAVGGIGHSNWTADTTAGQQVLTGDAVALATTANTVIISNASSGGSERSATCIGIWNATDVISVGTVVANFRTGLTLAIGEAVYLSDATGIPRGALTNVAPSTVGSRVTFVGYLTNVTGYVGGTAEPAAEGDAWSTALQARIIVAAMRAPVTL